MSVPNKIQVLPEGKLAEKSDYPKTKSAKETEKSKDSEDDIQLLIYSNSDGKQSDIVIQTSLSFSFKLLLKKKQ